MCNLIYSLIKYTHLYPPPPRRRELIYCPLSIPLHGTRSKFNTVYNLIFNNAFLLFCPETTFKEFETRLKYGWFHLKLYSMF